MNPRIKELVQQARATAVQTSPPGLAPLAALELGQALAKSVIAQFARVRTNPPALTAEAVRQRVYGIWDDATSEVRNQPLQAAPLKRIRPS